MAFNTCGERLFLVCHAASFSCDGALPMVHVHRPAFQQETNLHAKVPNSCGEGDLVHTLKKLARVSKINEINHFGNICNLELLGL